MAHREAAFANEIPHCGRQLQQPRRIRHRGAALAYLHRNFLLREGELFRQLRVAQRLFQRVQVFALQIFNERQLQDRLVVRRAHDHRDFRQLQQLRGPPAPFARDQFVEAAVFPDNQRLHNPLFTNGIRQFLQRLRRELFARLKQGRTHAVQRHPEHPLAMVRHGSRRCGGRGGSRCRGGRGRFDRGCTAGRCFWRIPAQQSAQTASQCRFSHPFRLSDPCHKVNLDLSLSEVFGWKVLITNEHPATCNNSVRWSCAVCHAVTRLQNRFARSITALPGLRIWPGAFQRT